MPANPSPHGVAPTETHVHNAWYMLWWTLYVKSAGHALQTQRLTHRAKAYRSQRLRRPRL